MMIHAIDVDFMPLYRFLHRAKPVTAKIALIWQFIVFIRILRTVRARCHFSETCRFNALQTL
jgi:hypothetical protein